MSKLISLRIDRWRWARGGRNGDAALLNNEQAMCCLGFACKKLGVSEDDLLNRSTPADLPALKDKLAPMVRRARKGGGYVDRAATDEAVTINDRADLEDPEREAQLKPVLAKLGFKVYFVG